MLIKSNFKRELMKLALNNNEHLVDLCNFLDFSPSQLSGVFCGRKRLRDKDWVKIQEHFNLNKLELKDLQIAEKADSNSIKINIKELSNDKKLLIAKLSTIICEIDDKTLNDLLFVIKDY